MNKIMLIGNLGKDPDLSYTPSGFAVTKFSIAVNRVTKTTTGEKREETDWFPIVVWQQLAETCNTYLHKGDKVFVEGRLTQRKYTDKQGIDRTTLEVIASAVEFLSTKHTPASAEGGDEPV